MKRAPAIGDCLHLNDSIGDFLRGHAYAVLAIRSNDYVLTEIDIHRKFSAGRVTVIQQEVLFAFEQNPGFQVTALPELTPVRSSAKSLSDVILKACLNQDQDPSSLIKRRKESLKPLYEARFDIFSAKNPVKELNRVARQFDLNQTRSRSLFFFWAAYAFDDEALAIQQRKLSDKTNSKGTPFSPFRKKPGPKPKILPLLRLGGRMTPPGNR